jgi:hypothetical protein
MPKSERSLEDMLRILANAGELTHLSIIPRTGKGPGGVVYNASFSPASKWGHGFGTDPDPVFAIIKAINDERFATLVKKLKIDTSVLPVVIPEPLTAEELRLAAGGAAPAPMPAPMPADEDWLRSS